MLVYFKDPVGTIRLINWHIGSPKPLTVHDSLYIGMISASKEEAAAIHDAFDNIPKLKMLPHTNDVHWHGSWARFIYSNL
jgi:hypothetical protein